MGKVCIELDEKIYSITNMLPRKKKRELFHTAIREYLSKEENLSKFFSDEIKEIVKKVLDINTAKIDKSESSDKDEYNNDDSISNSSKTKSMW